MRFPSTQTQERKGSMKLITATLVAITGLSLCAAPLVLAQDDSFVGKWNFNPDKSQLNGLTYKVDQGGTGKYKFTFGDDTETLTLGKEHVTKYGNTWLITQSARTLGSGCKSETGKSFPMQCGPSRTTGPPPLTSARKRARMVLAPTMKPG